MHTRPGLQEFVKSNSPKLHKLLFDEDDNLKPEGTIITRPDYADALDLVASDPENFYSSDIADDVVAAVSSFHI